MLNNLYILRRDMFDRWLICWPADFNVAWSGSRWVSIGGFVQVCNFETEEKAHEYAHGAGMVFYKPKEIECL